eukprot:c9416_g1_i2.p1 GENE.c9416_g1_i2~~c9416_g1_i2.p1  ORF type:complete len:127 (+),score=25.34 c9416_g1_i2:121-501(+)
MCWKRWGRVEFPLYLLFFCQATPKQNKKPVVGLVCLFCANQASEINSSGKRFAKKPTQSRQPNQKPNDFNDTFVSHSEISFCFGGFSGQLVSIHIEPTALSEPEALQQLVKLSHANALQKVWLKQM